MESSFTYSLFNYYGAITWSARRKAVYQRYSFMVNEILVGVREVANENISKMRTLKSPKTPSWEYIATTCPLWWHTCTDKASTNSETKECHGRIVNLHRDLRSPLTVPPAIVNVLSNARWTTNNGLGRNPSIDGSPHTNKLRQNNYASVFANMECCQTMNIYLNPKLITLEKCMYVCVHACACECVCACA